MTYDDSRVAAGYAYIVDSHLDAIDAEYQRLLKLQPDELNPPDEKGKVTRDLAEKARKAIDSLDGRGAWVEKGVLRHHKIEPRDGVIDCQTFADNVRTLARFVAASP
jgi:hypothetical protein